jgi:PAS domain S-box-containing protein
MKDKDKTQKQLIKELTKLRQRIAELEASERERKQVEETLKRSELEKAAVFDSIAEHVVYQDTKMRVLWVNRAAGESVGVDPQQLVGRHCYEIWPQRRKPCVGCPVAKARKSGQPQEAEMTTPDGRVWFIRGYPVRDKKGTVTGAVEVTLEITERKQAEEEIDWLASFPKLNPMPIVEVNQKGRLTYTNIATQQIFPDLDKRQGKHPFLAGLKSCLSEFQQTKRKYLVREVEVSSGWYSQIISLADPEHIRIYAADITARKRVEDTLRETNLFLRSILDSSSSISIIFTDLEQNILFWNKGAENIFGYTAEEVVGRRTVDILYPNDEGDTKQTIEEIRSFILNKKRGLRRKIKEVTKGGRILWINLTSTPRFDENGNVIGILGIGEDITERKAIEDVLRQSEEKYSELINGMHDTAWVIDFDGNFIDVNNAAVEVLGYSREELLAMGPHDIDSSLDAETITGLIQGMQTDKLQVFETAHTTKDGRMIPVEIKSSLVTYQGKEAILSIARDITQRKQMEGELRESEERHRTLFEHAGFAMTLFDAETGKRVAFNTMAHESLGYTHEEFQETTAADLTVHKNPRETAQHFKRIIEKGSELYETQLVAKNGEIRDMLISAVPIRIQGKDFIQMIRVDITDQKRTDKELRASFERLRRSLDSTVDALASMVEMKDRYTAGHQARVAQLACAIAKEMGLPEEQIEGIRMAGLIHDIGKIMVPAEILSKPGPLTDIQFDMVKMHPQAG